MQPRPGSTIDQLKNLHRDLETRLTRLKHHARLCPDEQLEAVALKKHKLSAKDRIANLEGKASASA